jgi:hypothetical protein
MKIFTIASIPDHLGNAWLQHLRDFDTKHPDCHFDVMADAPKKSLNEMLQMMKVNPNLTFQQIIETSEPMSMDELMQRIADDLPKGTIKI